ncbi:hypothetical protein DFH28DRAFT_883990 [Melampsora americana]|nr:hypothetical protein DFH28DRAFT_883990 [Melampsora americana]
MWILSSKFYPIRPPLPIPKSNISTGFTCPDPGCDKECVYFEKRDYDHLIGIRCSSGVKGTYCVTPQRNQVATEVERINNQQQAYQFLPQNISQLVLPPPTTTLIGTPAVVGTCPGFEGRTAEGHQQTRKISVKCRNHLCAACCRQLASTCSHHQPAQKLVNPTPVHVPQDRQMSLNRPMVNLPHRRISGSRPLQCAQANRRIGKQMTQPENDLISASQMALKRDRISSAPEITLRVWLKAKWPCFCLNEAEVLQDAAENLLGERWGLKLLVCQSTTSEWCLINSSMSRKYKATPTVLLIRAITVSSAECQASEPSPIRISTPPRSILDATDLFAKEVPDGWGSSPDSDIEVVPNHLYKRKHSNSNNTESNNSDQPLRKKNKSDSTKLYWPGPTLKLSELLIWCSKAPKIPRQGQRHASASYAWDECFGDEYSKQMKTAYHYRDWVDLVTVSVLKTWDFNNDRTVKEAARTFHAEFSKACGKKGAADHFWNQLVNS